MKYIRAKDNIDGERIYINDIPRPKNEHEKQILEELKNNIEELVIKEADTIEELCDTFVFKVGKDGYLILDDHNKTFELIKNDDKDKFEFFGAIWTNKGLIYVIKMKGILPNGEIDWELL